MCAISLIFFCKWNGLPCCNSSSVRPWVLFMPHYACAQCAPLRCFYDCSGDCGFLNQVQDRLAAMTETMMFLCLFWKNFCWNWKFF